MTDPEATTPARHDAKDWTVVISDGCAECGFDADFERAGTGAFLRASIERLAGALRRDDLRPDDLRRRPALGIWSPLEYAGHILGVAEVFTARVERMLTEDDPVFADWDGEAAAVADNYNGQDPAEVARRFAAVAARAADRYDTVAPDQWDRPARRSDGMVFTLATFTAYFRHEIEHHLHDLGA
ncbi:DinB family protein [Granulicoccus phenolivorans]|uniref:DinB family protein n=1 Tax=Granulicoccus phenolivorans TaxID=266854 RepID=UPI00041AA29B|nr:DinB family protein [Granulicoccus phenolivorans]